MNWPTVSLGEVVQIERRGVDPSSLPAGTAYLGLEDIERGGGITRFGTVGEADLKSNKFEFDEGHVLFGKLRPNLAKVALPGCRGVCSTDILPIRPGRWLDARFLAHYLLRPETIAHATSRATGANLRLS